MTVCPWCRREYEPTAAGRCPHCGAVPPKGEKLSATPPSPSPPGPEGASLPQAFLDLLLGPEGTGLPWERRQEHGFWRGLWLTLGTVLFSPLRAFRAMRRDGSSRDAVAYLLLMGTAAFALVGISEVLRAHGVGASLTPPPVPLPAEESGAPASGTGMPAGLVMAVLLAPLVALALSGACALGTHFFLRVCRHGRPLALSCRVACYAMGSASVIAVLPVCGSVLATLWYMAIASAAIFVVHRPGLLRAIGAAVLPPLIVAAVVGTILLVAFWRSQA